MLQWCDLVKCFSNCFSKEVLSIPLLLQEVYAIRRKVTPDLTWGGPATLVVVLRTLTSHQYNLLMILCVVCDKVRTSSAWSRGFSLGTLVSSQTNNANSQKLTCHWKTNNITPWCQYIINIIKSLKLSNQWSNLWPFTFRPDSYITWPLEYCHEQIVSICIHYDIQIKHQKWILIVQRYEASFYFLIYRRQ